MSQYRVGAPGKKCRAQAGCKRQKKRGDRKTHTRPSKVPSIYLANLNLNLKSHRTFSFRWKSWHRRFPLKTRSCLLSLGVAIVADNGASVDRIGRIGNLERHDEQGRQRPSL